MAKFSDQELEKRLTLYQVFLKLYEHHSSLLDEILQLENIPPLSFGNGQLLYLQGLVDNSVVYVITNLCGGKTQILQQPQQVWTIGSDRTCGIYIPDQSLDRRHAAIQYIDGIDEQGFYLIDFTNANSTRLNGETISQATKLKDGDRIQLGCMTIAFFINITPPQILPPVAVELLMQRTPRKDHEAEKTLMENRESAVKGLRDINLNTRRQISISALELQLNQERQSEILDNFFRRQGSERFYK